MSFYLILIFLFLSDDDILVKPVVNGEEMSWRDFGLKKKMYYRNLHNPYFFGYITLALLLSFYKAVIVRVAPTVDSCVD